MSAEHHTAEHTAERHAVTLSLLVAEQEAALDVIAAALSVPRTASPLRRLVDTLGAVERLTASRDQWRRDAAICADGLASVGDALGLPVVSYDPAHGTVTAARCVHTIKRAQWVHEAPLVAVVERDTDIPGDSPVMRVYRYAIGREVEHVEIALALGIVNEPSPVARAARVLDAINLRASELDAMAARVRAAEARARTAETAVCDIATALGALSDVKAERVPLDVDALAERCLREIERDQAALAKMAATADELTVRSDEEPRP